MESLKNTYKILLLTIMIFSLSLFVSCNKEQDKNITVRIVNNTNCTLLIYIDGEYEITLAPYTGNDIPNVTEGNKHLTARRDGDLLLVEDTYVELHAGDEYTWTVDAACSSL